MSELAADQRLCPFCAEVIKKAAVKCRWCGSDLQGLEEPAAEAEAPATTSTTTSTTTGTTTRGGGRLLTAALAVLVALAGAGLWLAVRHADGDSVAPDGELSSAAARAGIMAQAATLAQTAMSYRAAHADQDIAAAERLMTPAMRKKYEQSLPPASDRPKQAAMDVTVKASVASLSGKASCQQDDCAVSIVSAGSKRARVLVFVNQDATAKSSKGSVASPTWELLTLVKRNGSWLIDDMASA